jgi:NAD/NADP transhydrogenase beta subunit
MASDFAGIDKPLFYDEETAIVFGDVTARVSEITAEVRAL